MSITEINNNINHEILLSKRRAKREMTKKGFVNVDGNIMQYNPVSTTFIAVNNEDLIHYFNWIIGNHWQTLTPGNIIDYLKNELPKISKIELNQFNSYIQQSKVTINEELITDLLEKAIQENDIYKNTKVDFKGKLNLQSELTVLRNNDIYSDGKSALFKMEDGTFKAVKSDKVFELLRKTIGTEDTKLVLFYVKNQWKIYVKNLTNISRLYKLIKEKEVKEYTLKESEPGYKNVLSIIANYGGK